MSKKKVVIRILHFFLCIDNSIRANWVLQSRTSCLYILANLESRTSSVLLNLWFLIALYSPILLFVPFFELLDLAIKLEFSFLCIIFFCTLPLPFFSSDAGNSRGTCCFHLEIFICLVILSFSILLRCNPAPQMIKNLGLDFQFYSYISLSQNLKRSGLRDKIYLWKRMIYLFFKVIIANTSITDLALRRSLAYKAISHIATITTATARIPIAHFQWNTDHRAYLCADQT